MGYATHITGEFAITPPLTWGEIKASPFEMITPLTYAAVDIDVVLRVHETSVDTDEGTLVSRTGTALVMRSIDEYRERNLVEQVQSCLDMFSGHTFTGRLNCEGEENTDIWRVVVRNGRAVRVEPRIVWPDEDGGDH